jgi:hypothetical protein
MMSPRAAHEARVRKLTFRESAADLGRVAVATARRAVERDPQRPALTSTAERAKRKATCESCEHREGHFCGLCHCTIIGIAALGAKPCPAGKW